MLDYLGASFAGIDKFDKTADRVVQTDFGFGNPLFGTKFDRLINQVRIARVADNQHRTTLPVRLSYKALHELQPVDLVDIEIEPDSIELRTPGGDSLQCQSTVVESHRFQAGSGQLGVNSLSETRFVFNYQNLILLVFHPAVL